jgi:chromosome segregation ATPase
MLSFEERLTALEQSRSMTNQHISASNHNMTILLGLLTHQEEDLTAIKVSIDSINNRVRDLEIRFDGLETSFQKLEKRFDGLETRFDGLETRFEAQESRLSAVENRLGAFEHNVNSRFEKQDEKLDNVVVLLNTLIAQRG